MDYGRESGLVAKAARLWWLNLSLEQKAIERKKRTEHMKHAWAVGLFDRSWSWNRWYTEEKIVRGWLRRLGLYRTGSKSRNTVGFVPHGRIPAKGLGFTCSADFIDYNSKLIIHVDGPSHYAIWHPGYKIRCEKDPQIDAWYHRHGWLFLRLTDQDIHRKPVRCRNLIRKLVRSAFSE